MECEYKDICVFLVKICQKQNPISIRNCYTKRILDEACKKGRESMQAWGLKFCEWKNDAMFYECFKTSCNNEFEILDVSNSEFCPFCGLKIKVIQKSGEEESKK